MYKYVLMIVILCLAVTSFVFAGNGSERGISGNQIGYAISGGNANCALLTPSNHILQDISSVHCVKAGLDSHIGYVIRGHNANCTRITSNSKMLEDVSPVECESRK